MIKIYGMPSCPYCEYVHKQIKGREKEFQFIDIGKNIRNMSAFTKLRDTNPKRSEMSESLRLCLKTAGYPLIRRTRG